MGEGEDTRRLSSPRRAGEDDIGHVAVASDDLEARDGVGVADDIGDFRGSVLLDPRDLVVGGRRRGRNGGGHGCDLERRERRRELSSACVRETLE